MQGSTSSALFKIAIREGALESSLVLRVLTDRDWLAKEPDLVEHEAAALDLAAHTGLPVPQVVARDVNGLHCGYPVLLMTCVPGKVELQPADFDGWLRQMAEVLVQIHSVEAASFKWQYYSYNYPQKLCIPSWSKNLQNWERAIELVNQPAPESRICFIHHDFHPMNTLWHGLKISGIVDWVNACRGPAAFDLAWNRLNLMQMYGVQPANRLRDLAIEICGDEVWSPYWDLMALIELLPGPPDVYTPWPVFGLKDLSASLLIERSEEYLASVLGKF
jgi:aminoglycoside phosphotransferase (APT) family kinase protein